MEQINLNHAISGDYKLTEEDIDNLVQMLTSWCDRRTKAAVRAALMFIQQQHPCGIYERVIKDPKGRWRYIAGQLYRDEIRFVRSLLRGW